MLRTKSKLKLLLALGIMLLAVLVFSMNTVSATGISDEEYVKGLKLTSPKYYEVDLDFLNVKDDEWDEVHNKFFNMIANYYEKQVNDSTITISFEPGAGGTDGGLNLWTFESGTKITISKNGTVYDTRLMGRECTIPVITVPSNISDSELNSYLKNLITSKYNEFGTAITKIVKGIEDTNDLPNITNGYTVYSDYGMTSYIIVNKEKSTIINKVDTETNIKLETANGVIPENTVLKVASITEGTTLDTVKKALSEVKNIKVFDINLLSNGAKIQPNGKVKISIPIPSDIDKSKLAVYRVADNGDKTEYAVTINGDVATFETDHFSIYVLAEKETNNSNQSGTTDTSKPQEIQKPQNTPRKKDDTPKTGTIDIIGYVILTTVVAGAGIVALKKQK